MFLTDARPGKPGQSQARVFQKKINAALAALVAWWLIGDQPKSNLPIGKQTETNQKMIPPLEACGVKLNRQPSGNANVAT
jgi:hypothetical protein